MRSIILIRSIAYVHNVTYIRTHIHNIHTYIYHSIAYLHNKAYTQNAHTHNKHTYTTYKNNVSYIQSIIYQTYRDNIQTYVAHIT